MKNISVRLRGAGELEKFSAWVQNNGGKVTETSAGNRGVFAKAYVDDKAEITSAGLNDKAEVIPA